MDVLHTGADDTPRHDPAALERLRRWGGDKLLREMTTLFLHDVPQRLQGAREALAGGDLDAVGRAGHSLKSSSAQLGALRMQRIARAVEERADGGDADGVAPLMDELEAAFAEHAHWLREATP